MAVEFSWTRYGPSPVPLTISYTRTGLGSLLLRDVADWVRVTDNSEDQALTRLINDAAKRLEEETARLLINTTVTEYYDVWPWDYTSVWNSARCPVSSISSVKYYDTDDVQQTWGTANYDTDTTGEPARIMIAEAATLVSPNIDQRPNAVEIAYVVGYGTRAAELPDDAVLAIMQRVKWNYDCGRGLQPDVSIREVERCWQNAVRLLSWTV